MSTAQSGTLVDLSEALEVSEYDNEDDGEDLRFRFQVRDKRENEEEEEERLEVGLEEDGFEDCIWTKLKRCCLKGRLVCNKVFSPEHQRDEDGRPGYGGATDLYLQRVFIRSWAHAEAYLWVEG